jgi:glycogen(starch) synthase
MFRIAFVSCEPESLATDLRAAAATLSDVAEVTIVTSAELAGIDRVVVVPEPRDDELDGYYGALHLWGARVVEELKAVFPDTGPELIEFAGSPAEAVVTVQAKQTLDPWLRGTLVLLRPDVTRELDGVLNGRLPSALLARVEFDLERYALAHADRLLWPGDEVRVAYERFYDGRLARATVVPPAVAAIPESGVPPPQSGELRILYGDPFSRRNGAQNLLRAVEGLDREDWRLTLAGSDTTTGALGTSLRGQLELTASGDARVTFVEPSPELAGEHDLVVAPALWDCWPAGAVRALARNRPVLATPVGGHVELLHGGGGWLTADVTPSALADALEELLDNRERVASMIASGAPRRRFEELVDPGPLKDAYSELAGSAGAVGSRRRGAERPLVSVVVTYFELEEFVEEAVASVFEQTYPNVEVLVVNDGSFRSEDEILADLASRFRLTVLTQTNAGPGAARNFGVRQSRGRHVFMLDADNVATPSFVERCVEVLDERPGASYVSCWLQFVDEQGVPLEPAPRGYEPVSNELRTVDRMNVAGDAAALVRRRVFDLGFRYSDEIATHDDWLFYRQLARAGLHGVVIPERLVRYRVRPNSLTAAVGDPSGHHRRLEDLEAGEREGLMQWMA